MKGAILKEESDNLKVMYNGVSPSHNTTIYTVLVAAQDTA